MHARISGVVDHLAEDDDHALEILRSIVAHAAARPPRPPWERARRRARPREDADGLLDVVPLDLRTPYDARDLMRRVVDGSELARVQGALRHDARLRVRAASTATRSGSSPTTGSCSASPR